IGGLPTGFALANSFLAGMGLGHVKSNHFSAFTFQEHERKDWPPALIGGPAYHKVCSLSRIVLMNELDYKKWSFVPKAQWPFSRIRNVSICSEDQVCNLVNSREGELHMHAKTIDKAF